MNPRSPVPATGPRAPGDEWRSAHAEDRAGLITRAEIMEETKAGKSTVASWYANRAKNGHPEQVRFGRRVYFDRASWLTWYEGHKARLKEAHTAVDRSGNPNELVNAATAARIMGYRHPDTVRALHRSGHFPKPDRLAGPGSRGKGYRWRRRTVWAYADSRQPGRRPGPPAGP
jgi:predicted DNA-binding transcriptional regulator AlpA